MVEDFFQPPDMERITQLIYDTPTKKMKEEPPTCYFHSREASSNWILKDIRGINRSGNEKPGTQLASFALGNEWGDIVEEATSRKFSEAVGKKFGMDLAKRFSSCKLTRAGDNHGGRVHADGRKKVFAIIIYLDKLNWGEGDEGRTQVWDHTGKANGARVESFPTVAGWPSEEGDRPSPEVQSRMTLFRDVEFVPGRALMFPRSNNSWHSYLPVNMSGEAKRCTLQINWWRVKK